MIFALVLAGAMQVPDDIAKTLPHVFKHQVCVLDLIDYAGLLPADEQRDDEMINAALKTCDKTHEAAIAEFEQWALQQSDVIAWTKGKSVAEVHAASRRGYDSSLLKQIKRNMTRIRLDNHAKN